jgi:hypothetical protein
MNNQIEKNNNKIRSSLPTETGSVKDIDKKFNVTEQKEDIKNKSTDELDTGLSKNKLEQLLPPGKERLEAIRAHIKVCAICPVYIDQTPEEIELLTENGFELRVVSSFEIDNLDNLDDLDDLGDR